LGDTYSNTITHTLKPKVTYNY